MTDWNVMIQRFVDQELTGDERLRLLARLGHDEALRERLIELERLALDAERLRGADVPDGFAAGVMARIAAAPAAAPRPGRFEALRAPRTLHWNMAGAAAAACLALLVLAGAIAGALTWQADRLDAPPGLASGSAAPPATPTLVRLVVVEPEATAVAVAGDFNGWNPSFTPLQPLAGGAWAVTLPLQPGRYEYMFVVNGTDWIVDPFASEHTDDGFGSQNAVLDVRPPDGAL